jgi:hypothetical protein
MLTKGPAQQHIAYRLALSKTDDAVSIAEDIEDLSTKVVTLSGIAIRIKDHDRAIKLLDAAIDRVAAYSTDSARRATQCGAASSIVLFRAKQIGHPDLAGMRDKIISLRMAQEPFSSRAGELDIQTAIVLALTDPEAARVILARGIAEGADASTNRHYLLALALADPVAAIPEVDAELTGIVKRQKGYAYCSLEGLAKLLSQPKLMLKNASRSVYPFETEEE